MNRCRQVSGVLSLCLLWGSPAASADEARTTETPDGQPVKIEKIVKTDAEWRAILTPEQYEVTRLKGTERAWTGKYNDFKGDGVFACVCCGLPLFDSEAKFDSGTGWPSFWEPVVEQHIERETDSSHGMRRVEVLCKRCDAHLGHVFDDGPRPTGLRYCINSVSLVFVERPTDADKTKQQ